MTAGSGNAVTELLDVVSWRWSTRAPYPYADHVYDAPVTYFDKQFFVFGGDIGGVTQTIAAYSPITNTWKHIGNLKVGRFEHNVIWSVDSFIVTGGYPLDARNERCKYSDGTLSCTLQGPVLNQR